MPKVTLSEYESLFRREVYNLMKDSYEESFVPGSDSVKTPSQAIMMKPDFYRLMAKIALSKLSKMGYQPPPGFSVEKQAKVPYQAGGTLRSNPSTPRMFEEMYDASNPFFQKFFGLRKNPVSPEQDLFQQFKSTHMHMAKLYLRRVFGLKDDQFVFPKKTDTQTKLSEEQLKIVVRNQYRNYVISIVILHLVQMAYEIQPDQLDEMLKTMGVENMSWKALDEKRNRLAFGTAFGQIMKRVLGGQSLGEAILSKMKEQTKKLT